MEGLTGRLGATEDLSPFLWILYGLFFIFFLGYFVFCLFFSFVMSPIPETAASLCGPQTLALSV